jgi:hypothetical protein
MQRKMFKCMLKDDCTKLLKSISGLYLWPQHYVGKPLSATQITLIVPYFGGEYNHGVVHVGIDGVVAHQRT